LVRFQRSAYAVLFRPVSKHRACARQVGSGTSSIDISSAAVVQQQQQGMQETQHKHGMAPAPSQPCGTRRARVRRSCVTSAAAACTAPHAPDAFTARKRCCFARACDISP
jgi:hypothetical protein